MKRFSQRVLWFLPLLLGHLLFAQKKSVPGYYITPQHDTVQGLFPSYAQWSKNPVAVTFIAAGTTRPLTLTPQNTHKFVVEGQDEYLTYTGNRLLNPIEDFVLLHEKTFAGVNDTVQQVAAFLRLVTRTKGADLYVLQDARRINFFYRLPGQLPTELRYKKQLYQNQVSEIADYRQQVNNLFAGIIVQKNLTAKLEQLRYTEEELSSFLQQLFPPATADRGQRSPGTKWIVSAGAAINIVHVQADKSFNAVPRSYATSFSPLLAVGFIVPVGRNFGKYFFNPQVKLFRYKNTGEQQEGTFITSVTYQADLAAVAEITGGVNIVNKEKRRVFVAVGFGVLGQAGGKQVKQRYAASDRKPYLNPTAIKTSAVTYCIDASAGAALNSKLLLSATYMVPTNLGNFVQFSPKLSGVQLRLGYSL